jgi:hypothetical protein
MWLPAYMRIIMARVVSVHALAKGFVVYKDTSVPHKGIIVTYKLQNS